MDEKVIKEIDSDIEKGFQALQDKRNEYTSLYFNNALNRTEDINDERLRWEKFAAFSTLFNNYGFPDLALQAGKEAVILSSKLGKVSSVAQDIIAIGNAHLSMENRIKAEECYNQALSYFLEEGDYANAASAITNIAIIYTQREENKKAINFLEKSIEYLSKKPFPQTEINTRVMLMQLQEIENDYLGGAIENAKKLTLNLLHEIPVNQRDIILQIVNRIVSKYLADHPDINPSEWRSDNFPGINF